MLSIFVEEESYKGISEYIHLKMNGTWCKYLIIFQYFSHSASNPAYRMCPSPSVSDEH